MLLQICNMSNTLFLYRGISVMCLDVNCEEGIHCSDLDKYLNVMVQFRDNVCYTCDAQV